jgi:glutathione S-transferase
MSLTFYFSPMSTAIVTQLILAELDVPHEVVKVDISKGESKTAEFRKINPNGKVPVIVHDGTAIWESSAITMYLGETFGVERGLYPPPGTQRGEASMWIVWCNVTLGDAAARWMRNTMDWVPAEQHNAKAGEAGKAEMANCLAILDGALATRQFLAGTYTLADAHVNSFSDWLRMMKVDFTPYPHLNAWHERCAARPAYQKVMSGP